MKVKFLFAALLTSMSLAQPSYSMEEEDVVIVLTERTNNHGPRSGVPITASLDNGIISTVVDTYTGDVEVTIEDEDGETVISDVEAVSGYTLFTTNVASLPDGTYTIIYTLDNNTAYYGVFVIN